MSGKRRPAPMPPSVDSSDDESKATEPKAWTGSSDAPTDYEDVGSPSSSSTASGPVYVRKPGFRLHAHSLELHPASSFGGASSKGKKKKSLISLDSKGVIPSGDGPSSTCKPKLKKEPLPMKLRALPQSFWQQPNVAAEVSPAALMPLLPPLFNREPTEDVTEIRPITPPEEREGRPSMQTRSGEPEVESSDVKGAEARVISVDNPELLLVRLFDTVRGPREHVVKRGRPKKQPTPASQRLPASDDPCMVNIMTENFLPLLPSIERSSVRGQHVRQTLAMVSLDDGDKSVSFPALNVEHNYAQLLSEVALKL